MLSERLERESSSQFYACPSSHLRLNFEKATEYQYKCPECGILLDLMDNKQQIKEIKVELKELEKALKKL